MVNRNSFYNCFNDNFKRLTWLLILCFALTSNLLFIQSTHATDSGDWYLQRNITIAQNDIDSARRIVGSSSRVYDMQGDVVQGLKAKTVIQHVIVEDRPSKSKLGNVLLKRAKAVAGGNVAGVVGAAAVIAMIESVGWVMEEGTWVKYKQPEEDENCTTCQTAWESNRGDGNFKYYQTYQQACPRFYQGSSFYSIKSQNGYTIHSLKIVTCHYYSEKYPDLRNWDTDYTTIKVPNPVYDPNKPNTPQRIVITPDDVGGIAIGDYTDPVDEQQNINDKKYKPVVVTAYQHDDNGVGDEIADEIDTRIKTAQPTPDNAPAPVGSPDYSNPPQDDKKTNDRTWTEDAPKAGGTIKPEIDPTTGEPTGNQEMSLEFPVFCTWAHYVCEFIDWTKAEPSPESNTTVQVDESTIIFDDSSRVSFSNSCPAPEQININFQGITQNLEFSYTPLCNFLDMIRPFVIAASYLIGAYIVMGLSRGSAD